MTATFRTAESTRAPAVATGHTRRNYQQHPGDKPGGCRRHQCCRREMHRPRAPTRLLLPWPQLLAPSPWSCAGARMPGAASTRFMGHARAHTHTGTHAHTHTHTPNQRNGRHCSHSPRHKKLARNVQSHTRYKHDACNDNTETQ